MYKAQRLYPTRNQGLYELLYLTDYAANKIRKFFRYLEEHSISMRQAARDMNMSKNALAYYKGYYSLPSLSRYFQMLKYAGINNTCRDINYSYAYVKYSPDEIMRRLKRLRIKNSLGRIFGYGGWTVAREIGITGKEVWEAIHYGTDRSVRSYALVMFWIAEQEQARGFYDAMRFHK